MPYYFATYKPYQVLTQFTSTENKQCLADYFKVPRDVYPVGRLDYDSEGLLLLTNDKKLNHKLLDPSQQHVREYWVQVEGLVFEEQLQQLRKGVRININGKQVLTRKSDVFVFVDEPKVPERIPPIRFRKNIPTSWISLALTEGKNRQVRRMTAAVGLPTLRLIRYRIGALTLGTLSPGNMQSLSESEVYELLFPSLRP